MEFTFCNVSASDGGKELLHNVSGEVFPGELMAIMGPSGAGKTTLLNTLNGRVAYRGKITVGGTKLNKGLSRRMCYVLQQECFFGNLTLRETLQFTAMIRLPDSMSMEEKMSRMHAVVEDLDLSKCLDTIMGDMFKPGLSGGERKRASIACELLRDPAIIFLDEPTTGLDSSTAYSLVSMLKKYATKSNKIVIASIHQPSSQIFFHFDKLLLLTDGHVAYFGKTEGVVDHFHAAGIDIEENYNPADFILEGLSESNDLKQKLLDAVLIKNRIENDSSQRTTFAEITEQKSTGLFNQIRSKFRRKTNVADTEDATADCDMDPGSVAMSLIDIELPGDSYHNLNVENKGADFDINDNAKKWPTGFWTQYSQLTLRTFRESRKRILDKYKILENLVICGFVCLIFFQLPRSEDTLHDRMGAVFFIAAHWGFTPLFDAVSSFPMERMVVNKERSAGWYRLSAYYLAKMTSELVLILLQPTVFVVISYWIVGLNGVTSFFATIGTVFINSIAGQSFGFFIGIACVQVNQAMTVSITFQMAIMLLGGLFTRNIPFWIDWLKYLSFLHYSFHSLMVLEFQHAKPVLCLSPSSSSIFTVCQRDNTTVIPSEQILHYYHITWPYWQYIIPLLVFTVLFRILGYVTLRFFRKPF